MSKIPPVFFLIVIICFFLPFVRITCNNQEIATMTGFKLATGGEIELKGPQLPDSMSEGKIEGSMEFKPETGQQDRNPEIFAIFTLACAVIGLIISIIMMKKKSIIPAVIGVVGFIMLLLLKFDMDGDMSDEGQGMIMLEYMYGYWIAFICFILAALVGVAGYFSGRKTASSG